MSPSGGRSLLFLTLIYASAASAVSAQTEPMRAPTNEELDARTEEWVGRRRWMAVIIIGGTVVAGAGASIVRRRRRRLAREAALQGSAPVWPAAAELLDLDPPLRMDRLRKALRAGLVPSASEREPLGQLFLDDEQPALRVLVLEALAATPGGVEPEILERARRDAADSVRGVALQLILERHPERAEELARQHLDDPGIEVRALAADLLVAQDPDAAGAALLDLVRAEALGPRESHALRRAMSFFAEELRDPEWAARIEALRAEVEDEEGMIDWALTELAPGRRPPRT